MRKGNLRELENIHGLMGSTIRDSGLVGLNMAQGCGEEQKEILILGNGKMGKSMDTVFMCGLMVIIMRDNLKSALNMEKE